MSRYPIAMHGFATALLALFALAPTVPAHAAGEIIITHAKALAGNVTPGDTAGYPVTISLPGSYILASNLIVPANKTGILIKLSFVTIDLNGFTMQGSGVATFGIQGSFTSATNSATIKNGTITGFKSDGISGGGQFWSIEEMRVVRNGGHGISAGDEALVRSSTSAENGFYGVVCGNLCLVERSTATDNGGNGIVCGQSCHAEGNLVSLNSYLGIYLSDGLALGNIVSRNGGIGIQGSGGSVPAVYGNNVLTGNNQGNAQALDVASLHANYCYPGTCP
jgi:hypothetical protein